MTEIEKAIEEVDVVKRILQVLSGLPDDESRMRVMAIAATKIKLYAEASAFLAAAAAEARRRG